MGHRKSTQPFFLAICEYWPGRFDLESDIHDFDTFEQARTYAERERRSFGVGVAIYECQPKKRLAQRRNSYDPQISKATLREASAPAKAR